LDISAKAWKMNQEGLSNCVYRMQVNIQQGIEARLERRIAMYLMGWNKAGNGWNPKTGESILFFARDFGTTEEWLKWAKEFEAFKLDELDQYGDIKKYVKIGLRQKSGKDGKQTSTRQCSKCGEYGHNVRSCGVAPVVRDKKTKTGKVRKKRVERGPRKCGKCGETGHNSKTCIK